MYKCIAIISLMVVALTGCGEKSADTTATAPSPAASAPAADASSSSAAPAPPVSSVWTSSGSTHESTEASGASSSAESK